MSLALFVERSVAYRNIEKAISISGERAARRMAKRGR